MSLLDANEQDTASMPALPGDPGDLLDHPTDREQQALQMLISMAVPVAASWPTAAPPGASPTATSPRTLTRAATLAPAGQGRASKQPLLARFTTRRWMLPAILIVQAALSLRLVWSKTVFTDEALYIWAGHLEWAHWLHGSPLPAFPTYFSGAPSVYPPLVAIADSIGGLAAARILSLCFMLGATSLLYATAGRLFGRRTAICASALFAAIGPAADLGAFATYDAMAIALLALATWLAVRARGRVSELWLIGSSLMMALADATKYASTLWDPVILAVVILTATSKAQAIGRAIRMLTYVTTALVVTLFLAGGQPYIKGILVTTLARADAHSSVPAVLGTALPFIGVLLALAAAGVCLAARSGSRRLLLLCLVLAMAAILAPVEEARIHTIASLYKHVVFGAWFGAMPAGFAVAWATHVSKAKGWRIAAATAAFVFALGFGQASDMFGYWPSSPRLMQVTVTAMTHTSGPILADEWNALRYYLYKSGNQVAASRVSTFSDPAITAYQDPPAMFRLYVNQIRKGYFAVIEIDLTSAKLSGGDTLLVAALEDTGRYRLMARIPWTDAFTSGAYEIWSRTTG